MNDKDLNIFNMKLKEEANKNAKDPVYISLQAKNKRYETIERTQASCSPTLCQFPVRKTSRKNMGTFFAGEK